MSGARIVIAGASGFVGGEVNRLFERLGYETVVISRTKKVNEAKTPNLLGSTKHDNLQHVKTWKELEVRLCKDSRSMFTVLLARLMVSHPTRWQ